MKSSHIHYLPVLLAASLLGPATARGGIEYTVTADTSSLIGLPGAFTLDFQLTDGSGIGDGNNTVMLNDFAFGGGSWAGPASATLIDNAFFVEFPQGFTPGTSLSFKVSMTTAVDAGGTPDLFSLAILDNGVEIPTLAPPGYDAFLLVNIDSSNPLIQTFGTDPGRTTINIQTPSIRPVPEGGVSIVILAGVWACGLVWHRRQTRMAL